jgi:uncharacterized repeat protein (TIGR03943 family)
VVLVSKAGGAITVLVGAVLLRLALTGTFQRYVREGMGWLLVAAGLVLAAIGAVAFVRALRHETPADLHDHSHEHGHGVGVGWLLLAPISALLLVAPPTLGSFGVDRSAKVDITAGIGVFEPLSRERGPRAMTLLEFSQRAYENAGKSFNRAPVRLTGFMAGQDAGGFKLARYQIACCAADAVPVVVRVVGAHGALPTRDQWLVVTGTYRSGGDEDLPVLTATSIVDIDAPGDPYE